MRPAGRTDLGVDRQQLPPSRHQMLRWENPAIGRGGKAMSGKIREAIVVGGVLVLLAVGIEFF